MTSARWLLWFGRSRMDAPALQIDEAEEHLGETIFELRYLAVLEQGG